MIVRVALLVIPPKGERCQKANGGVEMYFVLVHRGQLVRCDTVRLYAE